MRKVRSSRTPTAKRGREIKAVLFDYGGTLFKADRPWTEVRSEGLASAHAVLRRNGLEMTIERFTEFSDSVFGRYAELELKEDRDIGDRIKYKEIVDTLFPDFPRTRRASLALGARRAFWGAASKNYTLRRGAKRTLKDLRSTGLRMGVVSNHHDYEALVGHLEEAGIHSHFEVVLASEREGVRKPNKAIFARSLRALRVEKEAALFVGDSLKHDIAGARAAGITSVLIDDGERPGIAASTELEGRPDFVIRNIPALLEIVESFTGPRTI